MHNSATFEVCQLHAGAVVHFVTSPSWATRLRGLSGAEVVAGPDGSARGLGEREAERHRVADRAAVIQQSLGRAARHPLGDLAMRNVDRPRDRPPRDVLGQPAFEKRPRARRCSMTSSSPTVRTPGAGLIGWITPRVASTATIPGSLPTARGPRSGRSCRGSRGSSAIIPLPYHLHNCVLVIGWR